MVEKIDIEELPGLLSEVKDSWTEIGQKCRALGKYKKATMSGFGRTAKGLASSIESFGDMLTELDSSLKIYFPGFAAESGTQAKKISSSMEKFKGGIEKDLKELEISKAAAKELRGLVSELGKVEKEYAKAEARTTEVCKKYFDARTEYSRMVKEIEDLSQSRIEEIRANFEEKIGAITKGYSIAIGDSASVVDAGYIFNKILENPEESLNIELISMEAPKGFLGSLIGKQEHESSRKAKLSVLQYSLRETILELESVRREEDKRKAEIEAEHKDLKKLEEKCGKLEERRAKLEHSRDELKRRVKKIRKEDAMKLSEPSGILEIKGAYVKRLDEMEDMVKGYLDTAKKTLKGYETKRKEIKKGVLKGIKELSGKIDRLERKKSRLEKALKGLKKDYKVLKNEHKKTRSELRRVTSRVKRLETEVEKTRGA